MLNTIVSISAPVTQEGPVPAPLLDPRHIHLRQHQRLVLGGLGDHDAERIADERVAPELQPRAFTTKLLEADAIHRGDPAAVRDRMAALNRLPGVELLVAVLRFF